MTRLPAPLAILAAIAVIVGVLFAIQAVVGDDYVPMVKNCGCLFASVPL